MKDPLFSNKIAGAVLAALILVFGLPQLIGAILGGGHSGGDALHLAYCCVDLETQEASHADKPVPVDLGTLMVAASVVAGERLTAQCASCHSFQEGGANGTGPNLWNIVNRRVASVSGFRYSGSLQALGGAWTYERLDEYIKNSQDFVSGTFMTQRIPRDDRRADLLAYLGSLSASPAAFPAPTAIEAPSEETVEHANVIDDAAAVIDGAAGNIVDAAHDVIEQGVNEIEDALQPEE